MGLSGSKAILGKIARRAAERISPPRSPIEDLSEEDQGIARRVQPYTMTSPQRVAALIAAVRYIEHRQLPGSIVECGVWKGGSCMAAALTLLAKNSSKRDLYLYDTFEGMSEPTEHDKVISTGASAKHLLDTNTKDKSIWAAAGIEEVRRNVTSTGYPADKFHFVQGKVEDTIPQTLPDRIAILRLDTDWYESTAHELHHLFPLLEPGGVLIIDDYGHWDGARKAVDEYFASSDRAILLNRIDYTGRIAIKT